MGNSDGGWNVGGGAAVGAAGATTGAKGSAGGAVGAAAGAAAGGAAYPGKGSSAHDRSPGAPPPARTPEDKARRDAKRDGATPGNIAGDLTGHQTETAYCNAYLAQLSTDDTIGNIKKIASDDDRKIIGRLLAQAERAGILTSDQVLKLENRREDPLAKTSTVFVDQPLQDKTSQLSDVQREQRDRDDDLSHQLHDVGPALSGTSVHKYINNFHQSDEYVEGKDKIRRAAGRVDRELKQNEAKIEAHGADGKAHDEDESALKAVLDAYESLAVVEAYAPKVVLWAEQPKNPSGVFDQYQARIKKISQLAQSTDAAAKLRHTASLLRDKHTSLEAIHEAVEYLENAVKPYEIVSNLIGTTELKKSLNEIKRRIQPGRAKADKLDFDALVKLLQQGAKNDGELVTRIRATFSVQLTILEHGGAASADNQLALQVSVHTLTEQVTTFQKAAAKASKTDAKLGRELLEKARSIHEQLESAEPFLTALGITSGAFELAEDLNELNESADAATIVKLVGDVATTLGAALAVVPVLAPIGAVLSLAGPVISKIAEHFKHEKEDHDRRDDERKRLVKINAFGDGARAQKSAEAVTNKHGAHEIQAAVKHGMTNEQVNQLAREQPFLFTQPNLIDRANTLFGILSDMNKIAQTPLLFSEPYSSSLFDFLSRIEPHKELAFQSAVKAGQTYQHADQDEHLQDLNTIINRTKAAFPPDIFQAARRG